MASHPDKSSPHIDKAIDPKCLLFLGPSSKGYSPHLVFRRRVFHIGVHMRFEALEILGEHSHKLLGSVSESRFILPCLDGVEDVWLNARHGGLGPAPTDPDRAAFLSWLMFTSNTLHQTVLALIHPDRVAGEAVQDIVQAHALQRLHAEASRLEAMIVAQDPDWLSPRKPGALGYYLGIILRWAMYLPEDRERRFSLAPYPALRAVLQAHQGFPAAIRVAKADGLGDTPFTAPAVALE